MPKARPKTPKTPAAAAPEKEEKVAELPPAPAVEAEPPCPYLLTFSAFSRIFDSQSAPNDTNTSSSESIDSIDTTAPPAATPITLKTTAEKFRLLQEALGVQNFDANPRTAAWVDFCFGVLCFARQESERDTGNLSHSTGRDEDEKALLLLTIANDIFQFATTSTTATISDDTNSSNGSEERREADMPSVQLCYDKFRECVRQVSNVSPSDNDSDTTEQQEHDHNTPLAGTPSAPLHPHKPTLLTHEVARFVTFMSTTFFRHLPAYQFVFRHARPSITREIELFVETPFPPLPLATATLIEADE